MNDEIKKEIVHDSTTNVVCPYCGFEHQDSWEIRDDSGSMNCDDCGKEFEFERTVDITFSTSKSKIEV
jgi:DNA-directed RNA polymerase subunit RPC12/RpoP